MFNKDKTELIYYLEARNLFYDTFVDLFENHSNTVTDEYSKKWKKPVVQKALNQYEHKAKGETS